MNPPGIAFSVVRSLDILSGPVGWLGMGYGHTVVISVTIANSGLLLPVVTGVADQVFENIPTKTKFVTTFVSVSTHYPLSKSEAVSEAISATVKRTLEILYQEIVVNKNETLEDKLALLENTNRTIELIKAFKEFKELPEEKEVQRAEGSQ